MSKASDSISQRVVLSVLRSRYEAELETRASVPPDERNRARPDVEKPGFRYSQVAQFY